MQAHQRLTALKPLLFHARFAMGDRLSKEKDVSQRFGPEGGEPQRRSQLVIATQVVEQSLDLDFDLVVSDLAPIDRIIQRAGRLCRHLRDVAGNRIDIGPDARGKPEMLVFGPSWTDLPNCNWYKSVFPKAAHVYTHHGQLWLTALLIREGGFSMPEDARRLIEGVYGDNAQASIPDGLQASVARAEGQAAAHTSIAHENGLKFERGYVVGDYMDWWRDADTPTRLGDATTNVRLARWIDGALQPWCSGIHAWDMSQVRVSSRLISKTTEPTDTSRCTDLSRVMSDLPDQGKWSVLLALESTGDGRWTGSALDATGRVREWQYCEDLGLRLCASSDATAEVTLEFD
jgi:CRISPR-associated endonuclease/helicase Cas3